MCTWWFNLESITDLYVKIPFTACVYLYLLSDYMYIECWYIHFCIYISYPFFFFKTNDILQFKTKNFKQFPFHTSIAKSIAFKSFQNAFCLFGDKWRHRIERKNMMCSKIKCIVYWYPRLILDYNMTLKTRGLSWVGFQQNWAI